MTKTYVLVTGNLLMWSFLTMIMSDNWLYSLIKMEYLAAISVTFLILFFVCYPKGSLHGIIREDNLELAYKRYYMLSIFIESYISISVFVYFVFSNESIDYFLFISSATSLFIYLILYLDYFFSARFGNKKVHE